MKRNSKKRCRLILCLLLTVMLLTACSREKEPQYLFIGDSYAAKLESAGYSSGEVKIWAVPGLTVQEIYNMRSDFPKNTDEPKPTKVALMAGINTLAVMEGEIQIEDHKELISYLKEYYQVPVYVQKVFPVGEPLLQHKPMLSTENVANYNELLQDYCDHTEGVYFFDPQDGFLDENGYLTHTEDNLHIADDYLKQYYENIMAEIQ